MCVGQDLLCDGIGHLHVHMHSLRSAGGPLCRSFQTVRYRRSPNTRPEPSNTHAADSDSCADILIPPSMRLSRSEEHDRGHAEYLSGVHPMSCIFEACHQLALQALSRNKCFLSNACQCTWIHAEPALYNVYKEQKGTQGQRAHVRVDEKQRSVRVAFMNNLGLAFACHLVIEFIHHLPHLHQE